jgi:hypothetical protein
MNKQEQKEFDENYEIWEKPLRELRDKVVDKINQNRGTKPLDFVTVINCGKPNYHKGQTKYTDSINASSLRIHDNSVEVVGVLPHNSLITFDKENAIKLMAVLMNIISE